MHPPAAKKRSTTKISGEEAQIGWGPTFAGDPLTAAQAHRNRLQSCFGASPDPFQLPDGTWVSGPAAIRARQAAAELANSGGTVNSSASPDPFQLPDGTWVSGPAAIRARQAATKLANSGGGANAGADPDSFQRPDGTWVSGPAAFCERQVTAEVANSRGDDIGIEHLSYLCPGLHDIDPSVKQEIKSTNFGALLASEGGLVVPCFQRTYCWGKRELMTWWNAVRQGKPSGTSCGKIVLARSRSSDVSNTVLQIMIIDGQQRLTTSVLFLASVRDAACKLLSAHGPCDDVSIFIDMLNSVIFQPDGTPRLMLSHRDASALSCLLLGDHDTDPKAFVASPLVQGKAFFDSMLSTYSGLPQMKSLAKSLLDNLPVVSVTLSNCRYACQVYLWLQEKQLFGESSRPEEMVGRFLTSVDLTRNLLLAPFLETSQQEQLEIYTQMWLPWEQCYKSPEALDLACAEFVQKLYMDLTDRFPARQQTALENKLDVLSRQADKRGVETRAAQIYAKLVAVFTHFSSTLGHAGAAKLLMSELHPPLPQK